jgi:hypothetical protein
MKRRVGIAGLGRVGKACAEAIAESEDLEAAGVDLGQGGAAASRVKITFLSILAGALQCRRRSEPPSCLPLLSPACRPRRNICWGSRRTLN